MTGACILIVEDDQEYQAWLELVLAKRGYRCAIASCLTDAKVLLQIERPALILLDASLPDGSGLDWCSELRRRQEYQDMLIALLTGRRDILDSEGWPSCGADTAWPKVWKEARLASLVQALLRRRAVAVYRATPIPGLAIDDRLRVVVYRQERSVPLSLRELDFVERLANAAPDHLSRRQILASQKIKAEQTDLALNEFIRKLRRKLPVSLAKAIQTIRGEGYRFSLRTDLSV